MQKRIKKLVLIVSVFIISAIALSLIWYSFDYFDYISSVENVGKYPHSFFEFLQYIIGYGEVDVKNPIVKTVMSVAGLLFVALLSSVFTVNLFEWRNSASISSKFVVCDDQWNQSFACVQLKSNLKDIYNIRVTLIMSCGSTVLSE